MQKEVEKELEFFLKDLELDGITIKNLSCKLKNHTPEKCNICKFFDSCPVSSLNSSNKEKDL